MRRATCSLICRRLEKVSGGAASAIPGAFSYAQTYWGNGTVSRDMNGLGQELTAYGTYLANNPDQMAGSIGQGVAVVGSLVSPGGVVGRANTVTKAGRLVNGVEELANAGQKIVNLADETVKVVLDRTAAETPQTVGRILAGHSDDTMIHITTATERELATATFPQHYPPHLEPGVFAESSWVKLGDVSNMTVPEFQRLVVGPAAAGHSADVVAFVTSPGSSLFRPVSIPNLAGVQEFLNGPVIRPAAYIPLPGKR